MPLPCQGACRRIPLLTATLLLILGLLPRLGVVAAEPVAPVRTPWTTSRVVGSPDPAPPFKVVRAFPKLQFERPLLLARCPGSDRLFVGEQAGALYSFPNRQDASADLFFDLRRELATLHLLPAAHEVESVYGLAFHPDFARNRWCYVCYTLRSSDARVRNLPHGTRISRFRVTRADPPRVDPASEEIVLSFLQGGHNGGDLHFGPDGMLYISTGDAATPYPPDDLDTGQDISDLLASILRIDVDRRDPGKRYAVPPDNPFLAMPGAQPEVWAYGFRNPWRMSFDRQTGALYVGDVGWELWEMIHRVEKGGNYGWAAAEGPQPIKPDHVGPTPIHPPLIELPHTIACSVTGGYVYRGQKFPELQGAYIFGDWETRRLWAARFRDDQTQEMPQLARPTARVVAFGEDHDGELYLLDYDHGTLHALERNSAADRNAEFPTQLSQTGLFASVPDHRPAAGVAPFRVNSRQWLDGATTEHWIALPGASAATFHAAGKPLPGLVQWHNFRMHFPPDAVLMRTLALGDRRIETQLLHYDGADWNAYAYAWRADQSDADLVGADGAEIEFHDGDRLRTWQFLSRTQCMTCHHNQTEYALGFLPEQLNGPGPDERNQLVALAEAGLLRRADDDGRLLPPFDPAAAARVPKIADPADESLPLDARARGYLHANCGHCHSEFGGGTVSLRLQFPVAVGAMRALGVPPARGDFGLSDAAVIQPGAPNASTLYFRMAKFGRDRMPHLGSEWPDEKGLDLIEHWIESLGDAASLPDYRSGGPPLDDALAGPQSALPLARRLGRDALSPAEREALLAAAARLPAGPVRDLFEGYLPVDDPGQRKLGSNPRPAPILALTGDAALGEQLFWSQAVNCGKCHRVGDRGGAVGPDLSAIGKLRSADDLLQSILWPSRRIEPKFAAYLVQTKDGRYFAGLLVQRDEHRVTLRDGEGQEIALAVDQIEELRPSRRSLMPDGQAAGLTAQQAADLLAYLASRQGESAAAAQ